MITDEKPEKLESLILPVYHPQLSPYPGLPSLPLFSGALYRVVLNVSPTVSEHGLPLSLPLCLSTWFPLATLHSIPVLLLSLSTLNPPPKASAQCLGTQQALIKYLLSAYQVPSTDLVLSMSWPSRNSLLSQNGPGKQIRHIPESTESKTRGSGQSLWLALG